jgi:hypothetical protein
VPFCVLIFPGCHIPQDHGIRSVEPTSAGMGSGRPHPTEVHAQAFSDLTDTKTFVNVPENGCSVKAIHPFPNRLTSDMVSARNPVESGRQGWAMRNQHVYIQGWARPNFIL